MGGRYRVLSHTADTGIEVEADSLGELFEWAARGMFELVFDLTEYQPQASIAIEIEAAEVGDVLVDLLSELLFRSEADDVVPCRFDALEASPQAVEMRVGTVPLRAEMLNGPPIKAVTYHDLVVEQLPDGGWRARVVFDV